jgi:hypothetical protein
MVFFFFGCFVLFETLRTILIDFCGSYIRVMELPQKSILLHEKQYHFDSVCLMGYGQMSCLLDNAFDFPSFIQRTSPSLCVPVAGSSARSTATVLVWEGNPVWLS